MAQSRPPPIRTQSAFPSNTTTSTSHSHSHSHSQSHASPPLSPRTQGHGEKKHHSRRKSGREGERFVVVSEKKRPSTLSRRTTPVVLPKRRDRERDRDSFVEEDGAGSGESFPQFCMSCEKQFLPANNTFLYCSDACRQHDLSPTYTRTPSIPSTQYQYQYQSTHTHQTSPPPSPYTSIPYTPDDGPDIIPRFSPTISRPRSYFNSEPYTAHPTNTSASYHPQPSSSYHDSGTHYPSNSYQPTSSHNSRSKTSSSNAGSKSSTALASLRSLATALPPSGSKNKSKTTSSSSSSSKSSHRHHSSSSKSHSNSRSDPESPPASDAGSREGGNGGGVWAYMPFTTADTPVGSYGNGNAGYGNGYGNGGIYGGYGKGEARSHSTANYGSTGGMGMDRPLPPRSGPGGYGHRPRSIDLVTPFGGV